MLLSSSHAQDYVWSLSHPAQLCVLGRQGRYCPGKNHVHSLETASNSLLPGTSSGRGLCTILKDGHGIHMMPKLPSWCRHQLQGVSGLQAVSLGTRTGTQVVQMGFENSPMTLLPLFLQVPKSPEAQPHC